MSAEQDKVYSQIFTLTDLISAPLIATVEGDFYAARRFVDYLRQYAFVQPGTETPRALQEPVDELWGKLRMVVFQYRTAEGWMEMQIPILSLIPMPLLSVSDASFRYNLRILGLIAPRSSRDPDPYSRLPESVNPREIMGSFAPLRSQQEVPMETPTLVANMDISIQMRQSDLPAGISAMLNIVQSSMEGTLRHRIRIDPSLASLTEANPAHILSIALLNREGGPLAHHPVTISADPGDARAHLLPPKIVEGVLISRAGDFSLVAATSDAGTVVLQWTRGTPPKDPLSVNVHASAQVDFPGNQFGPVNATAELQIFPNPLLPRPE